MVPLATPRGSRTGRLRNLSNRWRERRGARQETGGTGAVSMADSVARSPSPAPMVAGGSLWFQSPRGASEGNDASAEVPKPRTASEARFAQAD